MGYNYAYERAKFEAEWKKKEEWYRSEGMSEEAIQEMRELDWDEFKGNRIYMLHNQEMPADGILELMSHQTHGAYAAVNISELVDQLPGRYDWIERLDNPELVHIIRTLTPEDIELLTMYAINGYSEKNIASIYSCSQQNIAKKLVKIKKIFQKRL